MIARTHPRRVLIFAAAAAVLLTGCVKRTITVTSEPPGALVWLNDVQAGRTPVRTDFQHYGMYDIRLQLDGYEPVTTQRKAGVPWWDRVGPDLVAEALPMRVKSEPNWHFVLTPVPERSDDPSSRSEAEAAVIEQARETRAKLEQVTEVAGER